MFLENIIYIVSEGANVSNKPVVFEHPGVIFEKSHIHQYGYTLETFSIASGIPYEKLVSFVNQKIGIDDEMAERLSTVNALKKSAWLELQALYDSQQDLRVQNTASKIINRQLLSDDANIRQAEARTPIDIDFIKSPNLRAAAAHWMSKGYSSKDALAIAVHHPARWIVYYFIEANNGNTLEKFKTAFSDKMLSDFLSQKTDLSPEIINAFNAIHNEDFLPWGIPKEERIPWDELQKGYESVRNKVEKNK